MSIVLLHGKNYKDTAVRYDVSYSQVYDWVRKYAANGETGLIDRRGHHKTDEEVDETERLRRENQRLKRQLEEQERLVYLLKTQTLHPEIGCKRRPVLRKSKIK